MILVDTSVWIDHLHRREASLVDLLERDEVATHALVIEELALGSIASRGMVIDLLGRLKRLPMLRHDEVMTFVESNRLWGRGLSTADVHLAGSVRVAMGAMLWTRDKRLRRACEELGIPSLEA